MFSEFVFALAFFRLRLLESGKVGVFAFSSPLWAARFHVGNARSPPPAHASRRLKLRFRLYAAAKSAVDPKEKRVSALDAVAIVLKKASKPMTCRELIAAMAEQGLWSSPAGKTPHTTLYAAILREISDEGVEARFRKADRGLFEYAGNG